MPAAATAASLRPLATEAPADGSASAAVPANGAAAAAATGTLPYAAVAAAPPSSAVAGTEQAHVPAVPATVAAAATAATASPQESQDEELEDERIRTCYGEPPPFVPRQPAPGGTANDDVDAPDFAYFDTKGVPIGVDGLPIRQSLRSRAGVSSRVQVNSTSRGGHTKAPSATRHAAAAAAAAPPSAAEVFAAAAPPPPPAAAAAAAQGPAAAAAAGRAAAAGFSVPPLPAAAAAGGAADAASLQAAERRQQAELEADYAAFKYVQQQDRRELRKSVAKTIKSLSDILSKFVHKSTYCAQQIMPGQVHSHAMAFVVIRHPDGRVSTLKTAGWNDHPQCKAAADAVADAVQAAHDENVAQGKPVVPCLRTVQQIPRFRTLEPVDRAPTGHEAGILAVRCISNMYQDARGDGDGEYLLSLMCACCLSMDYWLLVMGTCIQLTKTQHALRVN